MLGRGNLAFCNSASHRAGRIRSRFNLNRRGASQNEREQGTGNRARKTPDTYIRCLFIRSPAWTDRFSVRRYTSFV